jgi:hypothetical protein
VYEYSHDETEKVEDATTWSKCAIVPLTDNARRNVEDNHPNAWHHRLLPTIQPSTKP